MNAKLQSKFDENLMSSKGLEIESGRVQTIYKGAL